MAHLVGRCIRRGKVVQQRTQRQRHSTVTFDRLYRRAPASRMTAPDGLAPCDTEPEVQRLRVLDPSNGAGWLNAVARANASDDEAAKIAALSQLAQAQRVDVYWTTLIGHLTRALADTHR